MTHRPGSTAPIPIGIIGAGSCDDAIAAKAESVGREIARRGWSLLCGGLGGVMEAASRGAREEGGIVIGLLPGDDRRSGNRWLTAAVATDFGHGRNVLIPRSSDGVIAISGGYGTLSEIGFTLKMGVPLVGLSTWQVDDSYPVVDDPGRAVGLLEEKIAR